MHGHKKPRLPQNSDQGGSSKANVSVSYRSQSIPYRNADPTIAYSRSDNDNDDLTDDNVFFIDLSTNTDWDEDQKNHALKRKVGSRIATMRESLKEDMKEMGHVQYQSTNNGIVRINNRPSVGKGRCGLQSIGISESTSATRENAQMRESLNSEEDDTVVKKSKEIRSRLQLRSRGIEFPKVHIAPKAAEIEVFESGEVGLHKVCDYDDEKSTREKNEQNGTIEAEEQEQEEQQEEQEKKRAAIRYQLTANVMTTRRKSGSLGGSGSKATVDAVSVTLTTSSSLPPPRKPPPSSSSSSSSSSVQIDGCKDEEKVRQTTGDDTADDDDNDDEEEEEEEKKRASIRYQQQKMM